jgi:type IX secretion system PorP/SprF family membrane protein
MKKIIYLLLILLQLEIVAQDRHFSQFYASPMTLNPALTGMYQGSYRVTSNYRSQWGSWINAPVTTFALAGDLNFSNPFNITSKDKIGVGLMFYRDQIGDIGLNTNQIAISLAYHKLLDKLTNQYLSLGLQTGLSQRSILYESLTFQDQWDGYNNYSISTRENLPENTFAYTDFSTGLNYTYAPSGSFNFTTGIGLHHFLKPKYTFYINPDTAASERHINPKLTSYFNAVIPINKKLSILPRAVFMKQSEHYMLSLGNVFKFQFDKASGNSFHLGAWARGTTNVAKQFDVDAIVLLTGVELNSVLIGFSYDLGLSGLKNYKKPNTAFEISLIYLGNYDNDVLLCPTF